MMKCTYTFFNFIFIRQGCVFFFGSVHVIYMERHMQTIELALTSDRKDEKRYTTFRHITFCPMYVQYTLKSLFRCVAIFFLSFSVYCIRRKRKCENHMNCCIIFFPHILHDIVCTCRTEEGQVETCYSFLFLGHQFQHTHTTSPLQR